MEGRLQTSHRRSECRFHNPRLQEARRLCSACQTLYIGRHKSFTLATFTSSFNSKSFFFFLSYPYVFINSYTNLIKRFHLIESRHCEANP